MNGAAREPRLSVIVPIYNVERYLDECLESVASVDYDNFEAILVDDGSTDTSSEIARRWCDRDPRFQLITQENAGLGAARNVGADLASGEYLVFLDSDDVVPSGAWRAMVDSLDETGSDFATGNVHRFDSGRTWQAPMYRGLMNAPRLSTHVTRDHDLLKDHLAPNKVWRSSFWRDADLKFPTGVLYEDVPTIIPAHVQAGAVDVLSIVSSMWRVRDRGDLSITQARRSDPRQIHDRVEALLSNSRFIAQTAGEELKTDYDMLALSRDLRIFVDLYPDVDEAYRKELSAATARFLSEASRDAVRRISADARLALVLLSQGAGYELEELLRAKRAKTLRFTPVVVSGDTVVLDAPARRSGVVDIPDVVVDVADELGLVSRISDVRLVKGRLEIDGWAYIDRLHGSGVTGEPARIWLESDGTWIDAKMTPRVEPLADALATPPARDCAATGFTASIPLRRLRRAWRWSKRTWRVMIAAGCGPITRSGPVTRPLPGPAQRPLQTPLGGGWWFRLWWEGGELRCGSQLEPALLSSAEVDGDQLALRLDTPEPLSAEAEIQLRKRNRKKYTALPVSRDCDGAVCHIDLAAVYAPGEPPETDADTPPANWELFLKPGADAPARRLLTAPDHVTKPLSVGAHELRVWRGPNAGARLRHGPALASLADVAVEADATVTMTIHYEHIERARALLLSARRRTEQHRFDVTVDGDRLTAVLPLSTLDRFGDTVPIRAGVWDVRLITADGDVPVTVDNAETTGLPIDTTHADRRYTVTDVKGRNLVIDVGSDLDVTETGTANQYWLRTEYYPSARGPIRPAVLYESYLGKQYSDSPARVFESVMEHRDDLEHLWVVRDQQFTVPAGATAVPYRSARYYEALATSRYIVTNGHLPPVFAKSAGQTVVQTWHGVGTKKIGLDIDRIAFANQGYKDTIATESAQWDYLVAPGPFASSILERAFSYNGVTLDTGAPRNDVFRAPDVADRAALVRERLGVDDGRTIVLYAPTWRDNAHRGGRYQLDLRVDLAEIADRLGDDHVLVFRGHANIADRLGVSSGVIDATDYPDAQDLLLATDILVTDYSTIMCDFANTGRPMLFYAYDLDNYRDILRDFYFDYESTVPGPILDNEADLARAVHNAQALHANHAEEYKRFVNRFCPWDDGEATARVVSAVFWE
ncbi:CDP-glycerol glycerophosphotransferase family protein [Stackebrandtia soli]|uniref:bifunctional glycosyltransferase/CDP-glycerol:glycerophosphate glycerophosphotransferase n=1 Tax=Stackebrandtia soli TaxID=1892856 RepID=UPI0039ED5453